MNFKGNSENSTGYLKELLVSLEEYNAILKGI